MCSNVKNNSKDEANSEGPNFQRATSVVIATLEFPNCDSNAQNFPTVIATLNIPMVIATLELLNIPRGDSNVGIAGSNRCSS